MKAKKSIVPLLLLGVLVSSTTFCTLTPRTDPSAAATIAAAKATEAAAKATEAAAVQAIGQATQMAMGLPTNSPVLVPDIPMTPASATIETPQSIPPSESCAIESEPFWHWQAGYFEANDFFFTTSSIGFAVGEPYALLRTDDGGSSWVSWPIDSPYSLNAIYFSSQEKGWVAGDGGIILRTPDGGFTWQSQHSGTEADLLVIKFLDEQTGWAAGKNGSLLYTTDGGANWSTGATNSQMQMIDLVFIDDNEGYLLGFEGQGVVSGVFHTEDGGKSWSKTSFCGSGPQAIFAANDIDPWVVGGWFHGIIWDGLECSLLGREFEGGSKFNDVWFTDEQNGWAIGESELAIYTQDGGVNWLPMQVREEVSWYSLQFISHQDAVLVGIDEGGIIVEHSSDTGITWSPSPPSGTPTYYVNIQDLDFVDSWFGWAVSSRSGNYGDETSLLITRDGGQTWDLHEVLGGGSDHIDFVDRQYGWAVGRGGLVARSVDGGQEWQYLSVPFTGNLTSVTFVDRDHGWILSDEVGFRSDESCAHSEREITMFRTISGGDDWEGPICIELPDQSNRHDFHDPAQMWFIDRQVGWIVAESGVILKTIDGGLNWQVQDSGVVVDLTDIFFIDARHGWVTGKNGVFLSTTDGGAIWRQTRLGDGILWGVRFVDDRIGWVIGEKDSGYDGVLLLTADGGETWTPGPEMVIGWHRPFIVAVDHQHVWVAESSIIAYSPVCLPLTED